MSDIRIQHEDFDPGAEIAALNTMAGDVGAIASFIGLVRADNKMQAMTLDHYPGFVEREIGAHVAEAKGRWPLLGVRVVHRVGRLTPGERIVFVGVASSHRQAAFAAAEFLMDYLKTRAPFWKLEEREDGATWVEARQSDDESVRRWR
jgi:molybdopterin synthase catalytic subunit